ncbi:Gem-associated protein 6 [Holothuria leucospilota]|uniref:Gem-associated protein 6 n=1 Tax=Holothuria leucospilota TaxID=206669 RepID=A0A9Q1GZ10_HOLLE|nr:Gem-associated protein 6 [Holothuria leucospilota]
MESEPSPQCTSTIEGPISNDMLQSMTPTELKMLVDKTVCIKCGKNSEKVDGIVYTVDPVSLSFIIATLGTAANGKSSLTVVPGHSVQQVTVTGRCNEQEKQALSEAYGNFVNSNKTHPGSIEHRKEKLVMWFEKNRIPVTLTGSDKELLQVTDALFIEPPYQPENCLSRNEIILGKVQALIRSMPD